MPRRFAAVLLAGTMTLAAVAIASAQEELEGSGANDDLMPISEMSTIEAVEAATGVSGSPFSLPVFWSDRFDDRRGTEYRDPAVLASPPDSEMTDDSCGVGADTLTVDAQYCPTSESIHYDVSFLEQIGDRFGPSAVVGILAHEWGHHLQALTIRPGFGQRAELQADCYTGVYLGSLADEGLLDMSSVLGSFTTLETPGDDGPGAAAESGWLDPGIHGTIPQRRQALGLGYSTGDPADCEAYGLWSARPPVYLRGPGSEETFPELTLPPGAYDAVRVDGVRVIPSPEADVFVWLLKLPAGSSPIESLQRETAAALEPASVELIDATEGWLDAPLWADGQGARAFLTRTTDDGQTDPGAAAVQIGDDGDAELFIAFAAEGATDPAIAAHHAIDALSWGYCDRWARSRDNCTLIDPDEVPPRPLPASTPEPLPAGEGAQPLPRATPRPPSRAEARRELKALVPQLACRGYDGSAVDGGDPLAAGAIAAVRCDKLGREVGGTSEALTLYRFPDRSAANDYWRGLVEAGDTSTRPEAGTCRDGELDSGTWEHGLFSCDVTRDGRAFFTWTDERHDVYGVLEARSRDVRALTRAWERLLP